MTILAKTSIILMDSFRLIKNSFPQFSGSMRFFKYLDEIANIVSLDKQTIILKEEANVRFIPIVLSGLVKVFKNEENGNEVLLYYIASGESCILSIVAAEKNERSKVKAIVEEPVQLLLVPSEKLSFLRKNFKEWNSFVYTLVDDKFYEVITKIKSLTFSSMIERLYAYLLKESKLKETDTLNHSHQEIANELGTSREVISRLLKKLEHQGNIQLSHRKIKIIS